MNVIDDVLPLAVRDLVRERILALEQLEILLLLQQRPDRCWTVDDLMSQLQLASLPVEAALAHLCHHELITLGAHGYRYQSSQLFDEVVAALACSYSNTRVEVLTLISTDAVNRVRRRARLLMRRLSDRPLPSDE